MTFSDINEKIRILSLEDSMLDFEIISEKLIDAGYQIQISRVDNAVDFTREVELGIFEVILVDFNLPDFDAFGALEVCRKCCPDIPVICVSGSIGEIMAIELLKKGAVDYVLKDRLERLPFAVKRALGEAREAKEKKEIELSLLRSEEKYRTIFENVQDVFYQTKLDGTILEISPSIKHYSRFSRENLIGTSAYDLYHDPGEREKLISAILKKGEVRDFELRLKNMDGKVVYTSLNATFISDENGLPDHIDGSIRDITERKKAEEKTRRSEAELNYAQRIARMGSWSFDLKTNSFTWSKSMFLLLGLNPDTTVPGYESFVELVHPDDRQMVEQFNQRLMKTKTPVNFDFRYLLSEGQVIWVQNNVMPVFENGKLSELKGVNIDITEKKLIEQELIGARDRAEASDRLKTAFLNNISHEIRTPLNSILGFSQIIADPEFSQEEKQNYVPMLNESSQRLLNTVTNVMDLSLLTSGNQKVYKKIIDLKLLLDGSVERFSESAGLKNIDLIYLNSFPPEDFRLLTDEEMLRKIIFQLLDNALKFTPKGFIRIGCNHLDHELQFFIEDSGVGISESNARIILENFVQEDHANTRRFEGTGIGLSIARRFVELLGGKLWFESEKGKGSTFYFTHPLS